MRKLEGNDIPIRFRAAANPPTAEQVEIGSWVKIKYVDPETREPGVVFIPASMDDNPYLDIEDYNQSLNALDSITRKQLRDGDWEIHAKGEMFDRDWFKISEQVSGRITRIVRFWDLAATEKNKNNNPAYTSGCLMARTEDFDYYILDIQRFRGSPAQVEKRVKQTAQLDGKKVEVVMEQEPGSSGKNTIDHYRRRVLSVSPGRNFVV